MFILWHTLKKVMETVTAQFHDNEGWSNKVSYSARQSFIIMQWGSCWVWTAQLSIWLPSDLDTLCLVFSGSRSEYVHENSTSQSPQSLNSLLLLNSTKCTCGPKSVTPYHPTHKMQANDHGYHVTLIYFNFRCLGKFSMTGTTDPKNTRTSAKGSTPQHHSDQS